MYGCTSQRATFSDSLKKAIDAGSEFDVWRLGDETARGKFAGTAIPFDFDVSNWLVIGGEDEDLGLDYAAIPLRPLYRQALVAGGACPLPREAWGTHIAKADYWAVLGVPAETVAYDGESKISAKAVTLVLEPTTSPFTPSEKDANRFCAKLTGDSRHAVDSINGMSGGPVFALRTIDDIWHYSVIGVQSGWSPSHRVLFACPFSSFASAVAAALREAD